MSEQLIVEMRRLGTKLGDVVDNAVAKAERGAPCRMVEVDLELAGALLDALREANLRPRLGSLGE